MLHFGYKHVIKELRGPRLLHLYCIVFATYTATGLLEHAKIRFAQTRR